MTTLQSTQTTTRASGASIVLGALIGVGYCLGLGVLGASVALSIGFDRLELPVGLSLLLVSLLTIVALTFAYFLAGFVAAQVSHQQVRLDSILHSLGTWATMSILIMVLVVGASLLLTARGALASMSIPPLITRVSILTAQATTTLELAAPPAQPAPPTREETKSDFALLVAWWITCASLFAGVAASIGGGLIGRHNALKVPVRPSAEVAPPNGSQATT